MGTYFQNVSDIVYMPWKEAKDFMKQAFVKVDVPEEDAEICANVLIEADLCGIESHGIQRLKMYIDRIKNKTQLPTTNYTVVKDQESATVLDAQNGMGQVISYHAMNRTIEKARKYGSAVTVVRNSNHFGIAGYYSCMAAKENMIGIALTNARPSVAPTFGIEPMLGTNPISCAIPSNLEYPFSLDMATSIIQRGRVEVLAKLNKPTPEGLVINQKGEAPSQDSNVILQDLVNKTAALLPLGGLGESTSGHKGYGLATMVEILSTALCDANYLRQTSGVKDGKNIPLGIGHFFMAIDMAHFLPMEVSKAIVTNIMTTLKESKHAPGQENIYIAGEKEYLMKQKRMEQGIPLYPALQNMIKELS
jgi:LDH2 family malate/lactate/ureidoglycolate dehydrogenase